MTTPYVLPVRGAFGRRERSVVFIRHRDRTKRTVAASLVGVDCRHDGKVLARFLWRALPSATVESLFYQLGFLLHTNNTKGETWKD